jgi:phasin
MTQASTHASTHATASGPKAKTASHTAPPPGPQSHAFPNFDKPNMEMPEAFRDIAEKGVAHAKDTYEKTKAAAEQASDLLKSTYATAAKGATDYNLKVLEMVRTNTGIAFDHAQALLGVKSVPELVELSSAHARKQLEAMSEQAKELSALAQKVTTEIAEPLKTGMTKAFNTKGA